MRVTPYAAVVRDPRIARLLPGFAASCLGDGMSAVAVSWLALQIAPPGDRGWWVALAVAAYTFPGAVGTFVLAPLLRGRAGAQLVSWDAALRAGALGAVFLLDLAGSLRPWSLVGLLAASSVLHAWGSAGVFTMVTELLPERAHVPANALLGLLAQVGILVGPAVAGVVIAWRGAGWVVALDAFTFAILAVVSGRRAGFGRPRVTGSGQTSVLAGFRVLATNRRLLGLLALTFGCSALYGPFEVGLPIYVADVERAPAGHLAWYFTAFGAGAVIGGWATGYLRSRPLGRTVAGIVTGSGAALLPLGLGASGPLSVGCYAVAGLIVAPYGSLTTAQYQRVAGPSSIAQVLAARRTVMILAGPVGVSLGGLLVTGLGVRPAFLAASLATVALGLLAALADRRAGRDARRGPGAYGVNPGRGERR